MNLMLHQSSLYLQHNKFAYLQISEVVMDFVPAESTGKLQVMVKGVFKSCKNYYLEHHYYSA